MSIIHIPTHTHTRTLVHTRARNAAACILFHDIANNLSHANFSFAFGGCAFSAIEPLYISDFKCMHICSVHLLANKFWHHITYSVSVTCVGVADVPNSIDNTSKILTLLSFGSWLVFFSLFDHYFLLPIYFHCCKFIII